MMFQSSDRERPGIPFVIEQEWFTAAKMRDSRAANGFWEMPASTTAILD
jgi:hypothetical protein